MKSSETLIALAKKSFARVAVCAIGVNVSTDDVYVEDGSVSLSCVWRNEMDEHIEGKFFYEGPSFISPCHSATIVIAVVALYENGYMCRRFPQQNFYLRNLDAETPEVVCAW